MSTAHSLFGARLDEARKLKPAQVGDIPTPLESVPRSIRPSNNADNSEALDNRFDSAIDSINDADVIEKAREDAHEVSRTQPPTRLKRTLAAWLTALFVLLLVCVLILFAPWTKTWVDTHNVHPAIVQAVGAMQSFKTTALGGPAIRVAEQQDPARSLPNNLGELSKENVQIATFFAKKYRLAATEVEKYIHYALKAAKSHNLESTLILAVMSIESNLNLITESPMGAQGLMQVLTAVHLDKLAAYGGPHTVFDPEVNIMVGAIILADCIKLSGSIEMGLKCYVGATGPTDNGYGAKVLAEKERIEKAKLGVYDFAPNNKVLIDMGLIAANPDPMSQSTQNTQNALVLPLQGNTLSGLGANTSTNPIPNANTSVTPSPLIPSTVTALPSTQQAATVLHNNSVHSVSGTVRQERVEAQTPQTPK